MSTQSRDELNKKLHQMVFVYNAVMNGWTVRKRSNGTLKFTKRQSRRDRDYYRSDEEDTISLNLDDYDLKEFIEENVRIEDLFR